MKHLFLSLLCGLASCLYVGVAQAQTYFNERYPLATGFSGAVTVLPVANGYWIAGGSTPSFNLPSVALTLQHLDAAGQADQPVRTWQEPTTSFYPISGDALLPLPDGGMALIGNSNRTGYTSRGNLWRFTPQGDTLWMRTYTDTSGLGMLPRGGCRMADGGFALVGEYGVTNPSAANARDIFLLRTDSLGREQWRRTYHQGYLDIAWYALATPDGGVLLSGGTYPFTTGNTIQADGLIIKVDALGQDQWRTVFGGSWFDVSGPTLLTPDGGYVVSGCTSDTVDRYQLYCEPRPTLFWFDSVGSLLRERAYGPARQATGTYRLLALPDGGYLLGGQSSDTTNPRQAGNLVAEGFLLRVCADGDSVWYRSYKKLTGGFSHNYLRDVKRTADGGFVGSGFVTPRRPDTGTTDAWVFKTDADGHLQAGGAPSSVVCRPVGLAPATETGAVNLWPNPAPDGRYQLTVEQPGAHGVVTDALGRVVWQGLLSSTETVVDLSHQPVGLYVLRLTWPTGQSVTKKLVR